MVQTEENILVPNPKPKNKFLRSAVILLTVFLLIGGLAYVWQKWLSPQAVEKWKYELYQKYYIDRYENAMREDTFGGKTPQETLDLFINALKNNDIELAAKYFVLNTNENSEYYLTRKEWEEGLNRLEVDNKISEIISHFEKAKPAGSSMEGKFGFEVRNGDNLIGDIGLTFNSYSGVWKIESL